MSCYTQDIYECIRMLKRGRPMFTHFFDQQHLYVSASLSSREILRAFQQNLWMGTAERIYIQEDDFDTQTYLSSFDEQDIASRNETAITQEMQRLCGIKAPNQMVSRRHLLTVLPNARCKAPKR